MLDEWPAVAAVEVAACDEVFGVSPDSCKGSCELFDDDPLEEPVETDPGENDDPDKDEVGTLSGSEVVPVLPVGSLAV